MLVRFALVALAAAALAACGATRHPATSLTLVAENDDLGRAAFHLRCGPTGGDLPDPAAACRAVARDPALVRRPKPFVCHGGPQSWWNVTVTGQLRGRRVATRFSTCWTPQMATISALGIGRALPSHVQPRRHAVVLPGATKLLVGLRPGDLVTCRVLGRELRLGVPSTVGATADVGFGGGDTRELRLALTRGADGAVAATCGALPLAARFVYCGIARTVNGFDVVEGRRLTCRAARAAVVAVERGARGRWTCSRAMHASFELECAAGAPGIRVMERLPVGLNREPGGVVSTWNWYWRVHRGRLQAREDGGGWVSLGLPPWCTPFAAPRAVLLALRLRSITADGGCFVLPGRR
ncbi:MAG TPA: hypothetical protein VE982_03925 [Gaiellaceae bacterium]|nr:hypothetical protein [Gaiellaceae bacterium]